VRSSDRAITGRSASRWHLRFAAAALAATLATTSVQAQDLGVIGPVYPIAEPSLLDVILAKLGAASDDGTLARLKREALARIRQGIDDPAPVPGLVRTRHPRHFHHDPSIVVQEAIRDADGRVVVPPGTVVNPLDTVPLSQALLFFDARDRDQVAEARKLIDARHGQVKPILTGGSYLELMRRWRRPVYYDQQGVLTTRLGIRQVPALVTQDGRRLRIDELP
jgi:conjugal transfer pilus assembly protein TraW